jgi:hypothetical protein
MKTKTKLIAIVALIVALAASCTEQDEIKKCTVLFYSTTQNYAMVEIENVGTYFVNPNGGMQVTCDTPTDGLRYYNLELPTGEYRCRIEFATGRTYSGTFLLHDGCNLKDLMFLRNWMQLDSY